MEIQITEEKKNNLFNRIEIRGIARTEKIPSRAEVTKFMAQKFSVPAENIKIKKISGRFGVKMSEIEANIYSSKEDKDGIEIKKKKDKITEKEFPKEESKTEKKEEVAE